MQGLASVKLTDTHITHVVSGPAKSYVINYQLLYQANYDMKVHEIIPLMVCSQWALALTG